MVCSANTRAVAFGDANGDGRLDVLVGNRKSIEQGLLLSGKKRWQALVAHLLSQSEDIHRHTS